MTDDFVSIDGLNELMDDIARIEEPRRQLSVARRSVNAGLRLVRDQMRKGAPVGKTGILRRDIRTSVSTRRGQVTGSVGVYNSKKRRRPARGGAKAPPSTVIAGWIEYGTAAHRIPALTVGRGRSKRLNVARLAINGNLFSRVDHPGISPKPWLRPAFDQNKEAALELMERELVRLIRKELKA